ncbi:hypothetical protein DNTS_006308, partial [Danionella cerebrum]
GGGVHHTLLAAVLRDGGTHCVKDRTHFLPRIAVSHARRSGVPLPRSPTKIPTWARAPLAMAESAGAHHPCPHLTISQGPSLVIPPTSPPPGGPAMGTIGTSRPRPLPAYLGAWRKLPGVSQWEVRTIRQGYTILNSCASFLREEIDALLTKGAVEPVPPADMERGFYSPYFLVPKKAGGLRPILDLKRLNRHLAKYRFKMLTVRCILPCIRPGDWFATIDLKDAYFQVEVVPRHRPFLRAMLTSTRSYPSVLPYPLAPFTKVVRAALAPLRRAGIRILDYLDDWLLIASSRDQLIRHQGKVLSHLNRLGLKVNWEKSHLTPVRVISFLGMELNSESMLARLSVERTRALLTALLAVSSRPVVRLKLIQRLLGHMSAAAPVIRLGLLRMRPLQQWLLSRVPSWAWRQGALRLEDGVLLRSGVPLSSHPNRVVVTTDASKTGWGAMCGSHRESGAWTGRHSCWHINRLELVAVILALRRFCPLLRGRHVLVRTDSTAVVAYINHQGGVPSRFLHYLAQQLLLWRSRFRRPDSTPRQEIGDSILGLFSRLGHLRRGPGTCCLPCEYPLPAPIPVPGSSRDRCAGSLLAREQTLMGTSAGYSFALFWPNRVWSPDLSALVTAPPWPIPPESRSDSRGGDTGTRGQTSGPYLYGISVLGGPRASTTPRGDYLYHALAPSTECATLASGVGSSNGALPARKTPGHAPSESGLGASGLLDHPPFLLGPLRRPSGLRKSPFEPWHLAEQRVLSRKTALLLALASIKRLGDLQALSADESCLEFGPGDSLVTIRPRPGFIPKVPSVPFRDQVVTLQALPREEAEPAQGSLCPVRALRIYLDRTRELRRSQQLFICFGGQRKGSAVSKQRLAHWLVRLST